MPRPSRADHDGHRNGAAAGPTSPVTSSTADIGAYLVLSHGSSPQASPATTGCRVVSATMTARAAAISGYTVKVLNRNGAEPATTAAAKVAAARSWSVVATQRHASAVASAAIRMSAASTAR
jgi:hypothetical protein